MKYIFLLVILSSCSLKPVVKHRDITYDPALDVQLDVYGPKKQRGPTKVLLFVHGGSWRAGNKNLYKFVGKGLARKGITSVVVGYRLSDKTTYKGMAADVASAIKWTRANIYRYGGDPQQLFISGHSAGGHLAALVATDHRYFDSLKMDNPIKGVILIDAFGLDMYKYFSVSTSRRDSVYLPAFTKDTAAWKDGSPAYHLHDGLPRFLLLVGGKTYPAITNDNLDFYYALKEFPFTARLVTVKRKNHTEMVTQFYFPRSKGYAEVLKFIDETE